MKFFKLSWMLHINVILNNAGRINAQKILSLTDIFEVFLEMYVTKKNELRLRRNIKFHTSSYGIAILAL